MLVILGGGGGGGSTRDAGIVGRITWCMDVMPSNRDHSAW